MKRYRIIVLLVIAILLLFGCNWFKATEAEVAPTPYPTYTAYTPTPPCQEEEEEAPTTVPEEAPTATEVPECQAMLDGKTNCECIEAFLSGTGSTTDPIIYPDWYLHDLCFAKAGQGTGAKYIIVPGPAALQMGESTGPVRMVFVPFGTSFQGWTQGGWRYISDYALLAQWHGENEVGNGLICGYEIAIGSQLPTYRWDGNREIRDESLDCKKTRIQAVVPTVAPAPVVEEAQPVKEDWEIFPEIFKAKKDSNFYCGARTTDVTYPPEWTIIEKYPKEVGDKNYLHASGQFGMSTENGFCSDNPAEKHGAPSGTKWQTVLLESDGLKPVTFPLQ